MSEISLNLSVNYRVFSIFHNPSGVFEYIDLGVVMVVVVVEAVVVVVVAAVVAVVVVVIVVSTEPKKRQRMPVESVNKGEEEDG